LAVASGPLAPIALGIGGVAITIVLANQYLPKNIPDAQK